MALASWVYLLTLPGIGRGGLGNSEAFVAGGRCPGSVTQCAREKINPLERFLPLPNKEMRLAMHPRLSPFPALVMVITLVIWVQEIKVHPAGLCLA